MSDERELPPGVLARLRLVASPGEPPLTGPLAPSEVEEPVDPPEEDA